MNNKESDMKKIQCLFKRDYEDAKHRVYNAVLEGSEWVINGEGVATRKLNGTCCLITKKDFYKRYTVKKDKKPPNDFIAATEIDEMTGKQVGWIPVKAQDKYHLEGYNNLKDKAYGTYELCGPRVQGNPEGYWYHTLIKHGSIVIRNVPRDFFGLTEYFKRNDIEGIVWHHSDGRMVKIKGVDFGIERNSVK